VALYKSFTLKTREALASFVGLASPHAEHGIATCLPEAVNHSGVLLEMIIQGGPMSRDPRSRSGPHDGVERRSAAGSLMRPADCGTIFTRAFADNQPGR